MKSKKAVSYWWSVLIPVSGNSEIISTILFEHGAAGIHETDACLTAFFQAWTFIGADEAIRTVQSWLPGRNGIRIEKIAAQNWNENWKKYFRLTRIARRIVIRPSWIRYRRKAGEAVIVIDPKMGFGTGTHETTQLMLRLMEPRMQHAARVLDIGTGSGILAIAAVKLGAQKVFGFDVEQEAVENASENIDINYCRDSVKLHCGDIDHLPKNWPKTYDMILANIQRSVIADILPEMIKRTKPGGLIILSGILKEELHMMFQLFKNHYLIPVKTLAKNEWLGFVVRV